MSGRGFLLNFWIAVSFLATGAGSAFGQEGTIDREYELKAAYLYNFGKYVEWPKNATPGDGNTFVIGVLGKDPFGNLLDDIAASKMLQDKKVVIRRFASAKDYQPCHILFISAATDENADEKTGEERANAALDKTKGAPVLLVGERAGLAPKGAMISFFVEDNKLKLEINPSAATRAGLKISSKLLGLQIVKIV